MNFMSDIGGVTVAILLLIRTISHEFTIGEGGGIHGVLETTVIPYMDDTSRRSLWTAKNPWWWINFNEMKLSILKWLI